MPDDAQARSIRYTDPDKNNTAEPNDKEPEQGAGCCYKSGVIQM